MPLEAIPTSNLDQNTDSPSLAREDLLKLVQGYNLMVSDARLYLSVDPIVIPVSGGGVLDFTGANTQVKVLRYGQDETSLWTISKSDSGCTSILSGSTLTISALSTDSGYVGLTATRSGQLPLNTRLLVVRNQAVGSGISVDLTPPPTVSGLAVTAGIDTIYVSFTAPSYLQGRGNAQTNIYGATYTGPTAPVFTDGSVKRIGTAPGFQTFLPIATEPATKWVVWAKFQSKDGVESTIPSPSAASGVTAETSADITKLLEALTNRITVSELNSALSSEIALISAPSGVANSVNQRLASLSSSITASGATSFEPFILWDFNGSLGGWVAGGASATTSTTLATVTSTSTDPQFASPTGLTIDGSVYDKVRARIRRTAGSGWDGTIFFTTSTGAAHGFSYSYYKTNSNNPALNTWITVEWDMSALDVGGTDWITSTISGIRVDLGATASDVFQVDWVSVGRSGVGASYAALELEASTRASADGHIGSQFTLRTTVASDGRTIAGGFGVTGTSVPGQGPTIDFGVMANTFWIAAPSGSGVNSTVPFSVQTTDIVDSATGQLQPKGVYIDSAYIKNLNALWGRFGTLIATSIQATDISTDKITLGSGVVGTTLKSSNYVLGVSGWALVPGGAAQLPSASILGLITAAQINANGLTIRTPGGAVLLDAGSGNFSGDVTGTVGGTSVSSLVTTANNFNASNDRNSAAIAAVTFPLDGTVLDHVLNTDGSSNISLEWVWSGANGDIDGFLIYVYTAGTGATYTMGTSPASETVYVVPAEKRAFFVSGVSANLFYTFGVKAYRKVDKDVNSSGIIASPMAQPGLASENPYQPVANIAFNGNVAGTINGVAAATLTGQAADGSAAYVYRPNLLPNGGFEQGLTGIANATTFGFSISDSATWGRVLSSTTLSSGANAILWPAVTVSAGTWYTVHGDAALTASAGFVYFDILFFDSSNALILDGPQNPKNASFDFASDDSNRRTMAVEVLAPAGSVTARVEFAWFGLTSATYVGCRLVKLERGRLPYTPYSADTSLTATVSAVSDPTTGLTSRLRNNAQNVLAGPGGLSTGTLTWDSAGNRTGGFGVGITQNGIVAYDSTGAAKFVLDGFSGSATFAGSLNGASGTFYGTMQVGSTPVISGTTMTGSGAVFNSSGTFAIGNSTTNITFNGSTLTLNGAVVTESNLVLSSFSSSFPAGAISFSVAPGDSYTGTIGTRTVSVSGGTGPYTYSWTVIDFAEDNAASIWVSGGGTSSDNFIVLNASCLSGGDASRSISVSVTDSRGRTSNATFGAHIVSLT